LIRATHQPHSAIRQCLLTWFRPRIPFSQSSRRCSMTQLAGCGDGSLEMWTTDSCFWRCGFWTIGMCMRWWKSGWWRQEHLTHDSCMADVFRGGESKACTGHLFVKGEMYRFTRFPLYFPGGVLFALRDPGPKNVEKPNAISAKGESCIRVLSVSVCLLPCFLMLRQQSAFAWRNSFFPGF